MGRWMSPDPGWFLASHLSNPQSWNQYAYVLNNPSSLDFPGPTHCRFRRRQFHDFSREHMKAPRILAIILFCFGIFELAMVMKSVTSRRKATMMLQAADTFRLGLTSKAQAQTSFSHIGLKTSDEACSASRGSCEGIAVEIANTPELSENTAGRIASYAIAHISVLRPASLTGNFYFVSDRLKHMSVRLATARADVGVELKATDYDEDAVTIMRHDYHTGSDTFEQNAGPSRQGGVSLGAARLLNLNCLESLFGCSANGELWLRVPSRASDNP
jgi:hypothetical protein